MTISGSDQGCSIVKLNISQTTNILTDSNWVLTEFKPIRSLPRTSIRLTSAFYWAESRFCMTPSYRDIDEKRSRHSLFLKTLREYKIKQFWHDADSLPGF